ncbi:RNAse R [Cohaesibacter sp. ES.047]|uniref:ribonuclease R n=1 Tax=Cohaesibacter sp. ES.047 TaxID=1798205 RepID=UPI000BC09FA6|nr:ribonuclease R [Cohaesibacter sp. ES.047]SNY93908.1 RNAse R [Cohaesibacter sp. ES.047]
MIRKRRPTVEDGLPSKEEILAFIAENPGKAGKREIARAFGITGGARIGLKRLLKELTEDGHLEKSRKRLTKAGELPAVGVYRIVERDPQGDLIGLPVKWESEEHGEPPRLLIQPDKKSKAVPGIGDRVLAKLIERDLEAFEMPGIRQAVRVIKILPKREDSILGIYRRDPINGGGRLVPIDKKTQELSIDDSGRGEAEEGDLVAVSITRSGRSRTPRAHVREVIGPMASEQAVSMIAIHALGIPYIFPENVLGQAERATQPGMKGREDWRDLPLITIDPADAKDHDDAIYAEADSDPANEGGTIAYVAIADVAYHIPMGSDLDREAFKRGNSVYFPDRVVPMLPERISNNLCSLKEGEDRPSMAVRMVFDKKGQKKRHSFHRVMIRVAAGVSYNQAQSAIDGQTDETTAPILESILKPLWQGYETLKVGRDAREPLELDLPERKMQLKPDGTIDRVYVPPRLDAHKLVEEFMIQANVAAAETLEKHKQALIYRIHDNPSPEKLEGLREFLGSLDLSFPKGGNLRPANFNAILNRTAGTEHAPLVSQVVLRSQAQAEYNPDNIGHFGLNLLRYAHFTSPIRRYADLIVHRALIAALKLGEDGLPKGFDGKLADIAAQISTTERRAMLAERDTKDRLIAAFLADRVGATFHGRISGVTRVGLFVQLADTGADGFIPASTLGQDYYHFDEANHRMVGEATGETFRLGDTVEVKLVEAAPMAGALRFEMLTEGPRDPKSRMPRNNWRKGKSKTVVNRTGQSKKKPGTTRARSKKGRGR